MTASGNLPPVSDIHFLDMTAEEAGNFMDNITMGPPPTPEEEAALLAQLPPADPDAPIIVLTLLRIPLELHRGIDAAAKAENVSASTFICRAIESALAGRDRGEVA